MLDARVIDIYWNSIIESLLVAREQELRSCSNQNQTSECKKVAVPVTDFYNFQN